MKNLFKFILPMIFTGNILSISGTNNAYAHEEKSVVSNTLNQKVNEMYTEFLKLLDDANITKEEINAFFNKYFDKMHISYLFTGNKKEQNDLYEILKEYFKYLLTGNILRQVKDYELSKDSNQITKKHTTIVKCKLKNKKDKSNTIDMSIAFANNNLIKDLCFMGSVFVIKGAKNIVELHCQEKGINYRKLNVNEKLETIKTSLTEYMKKPQVDKK